MSLSELNTGLTERVADTIVRFPKMTNGTISETLNSRFAAVGTKNEKRWVYVDPV